MVHYISALWMTCILVCAKTFGQHVLKLNVFFLYSWIDDHVRSHENELKSYIHMKVCFLVASFIYAKPWEYIRYHA